MIGWVGDIERLTLDNDTFRTVLFTGAHTQLTVMRLAPGEDIGKEVHSDRDQFIRIEEGQARVEFGRDEDGVDAVGPFQQPLDDQPAFGDEKPRALERGVIADEPIALEQIGHNAIILRPVR